MSRRRAAAFLAAVAVIATAAFPTVVATASSSVDRVLRDPRITESSGLAASTLHPGVLYTHNDSEAGPEVFAIGADGATRAVLTLRGAQARDWEGMSPGKAGTNTVWVGDIGDNIDGWGTYLVYRFSEPKQLEDRLVAWKGYELRYEDGESRNAEALLVHPVTGRLYVVTKEVMGAAIYVAPATLSESEPNVLSRVAKSLPYATDAAFSPDGTMFVVRGYVDAKVYRTAKPGTSIATIDLPVQPQGESIAWSPDGQFLYAGSEGGSSKVYRVALPASVTQADANASATATATSSPSGSDAASTDSGGDGPTVGDSTDDSSGGLPRAQVWWLALGAVVLIGLGFSLRSWSKRDPDEA